MNLIVERMHCVFKCECVSVFRMFMFKQRLSSLQSRHDTYCKGRMSFPQSLQDLGSLGRRRKEQRKGGSGEGKSSKPLAVMKSHSKLP